MLAIITKLLPKNLNVSLNSSTNPFCWTGAGAAAASPSIMQLTPNFPI
jgi:hypothetical protein